MKKTSAAILVSLMSVAAAVYAQAPETEIRESTDPAKAADVEQRAREIQSRQESGARSERREAASGTSDEGASTKQVHKKKKKAKARKSKAAAGSSGTSSGTSGASSGASSGGESSGASGSRTETDESGGK